MAGKHLLETCHHSQGLCHWGGQDRTAIGFAHGASGIATFLLYLYLATGQEKFLVTGQHGLEFDLSHAVDTKDGGLSWRESVQVKSPYYPYWQYGSAGIGMSVLRYWRLLAIQSTGQFWKEFSWIRTANTLFFQGSLWASPVWRFPAGHV